MRKPTTWDTLLYGDNRNTKIYRTKKSKEELPKEGDIIIASKLGDISDNQVIVVGENLFEWEYEITDKIYCTLQDDFVWRGCGGFDF